MTPKQSEACYGAGKFPMTNKVQNQNAKLEQFGMGANIQQD